ncbi:MAG: hypothetical protein HY905_10650 [Deltaproteobacteria bacterium]|nr:hypothetical protein [Deltaproteobacteria bacterium]
MGGATTTPNDSCAARLLRGPDRRRGQPHVHRVKAHLDDLGEVVGMRGGFARLPIEAPVP